MTALRYQHTERWLLLGVGFIFLLVQARFAESVLAGMFPDNDDMLRLQQVRDLLAGQGWLNVNQTRFLTPEGGDIHWSRLPDILIGGLILVTRPLLGQAGAETFALIVYPLSLFAWAMAMIAQIARRLGATISGQVVAITLFALSAAAFNFWPGRIDHHNLVVVLILTGVAAMLSPKLSLRSAIISAFCLVAALSVAIESLPYVGALIAGFGLLWIIRGHSEGGRLAGLGAAIAVFALTFYLLDAPGWSTRRDICDAYGTSHFAGLISGGILLGLIGTFGGWFDTWVKRFAGGLVAGLITLAVVIAVNPACLGDPYAEVSEQVHIGWLSAVGEARSLPVLWGSAPAQAVWQFGFIIAGLIALLITVWRAPSHDRLPRLVFALFVVFSAAATVWQIRGVTFSHAFVAIIGGVLIGEVFVRWRQNGGLANVLILVISVLFLAPTTWQTWAESAFPTQGETLRTAPDGRSYRASCRDVATYRGLASLPAEKVLTPIDLGMSLLIHTDHIVLGGPYHRNIRGIEQVTRFYMSPPEEAYAQIEAMGATHILYCAGLSETARYAKLAPESLAAQMEKGDVPEWMAPDDKATGYDGVVRLYRVKPL